MPCAIRFCEYPNASCADGISGQVSFPSMSFLLLQPMPRQGLRLITLPQLSVVLLLLSWSCRSSAQPLSQQLALTASAPNITLHNYTLNGQTLYTVCPCKDRWQFRLQNGTLLELSGCANPEDDTAGPFCEIDPRATRCPSSETLSMNTTGRGRRLVVPCLPQRKKTIAGCLCSSFWTERDDVPFVKQWPILPRDQLQQGLHEGWLLAGNCSAALSLPGGARCTVVEGSCSSIPAKAYPPPNPNIFWQMTSADDQGWDFCADPTYDSQRAAQPNTTAELLAGLPANVQAQVQLQTQAGCTCSPGNWTYYPAQIADADGPQQTFLGCANPDNDPVGDWCPVDPVSCPSYYGAKQPSQPGDVPRDMWFTRVYFDYCGAVRNKTESGCLCLGNWKPTFNSSLESQPNENGIGIRPDPEKITVISGGVCSNPKQLQRQQDWCFVDYRTCGRQPAGTAGKTSELHWDYCAATAPAAATVPPAQPASSGGIYLPPTAALPASPEGQPGVYLPSVPTATAAQEANRTAPASAPAPAGTGSRPAAPVAGANATPATVAGNLTVPTDQHQTGSGSSSATVIGAVVGSVVAALIIAALAGLLLRRRHRHYKKQTSLQWVTKHLPDFQSGSNGDVELGGHAGGGRGGALGSRYQQSQWGVSDGAGDNFLGVAKLQPEAGPGGKPGRMQYTGHLQLSSKLPGTLQLPGMDVDAAATPLSTLEGTLAAPVAPAAAAEPAAAARGVSMDEHGPHSFASSAQGSHVPLMGHKGYVSSSKDGHLMAAAAAAKGRGSAADVITPQGAHADTAAAGTQHHWTAGGERTLDGSSGSGPPHHSRSDNPAEAARQSNMAAAAAAAAAEERAASLAALWDAAEDQQLKAAATPAPALTTAGNPNVPTVAAAGFAMPMHHHQQQQQQQGLAESPGAHVARLISSPFASKGSAVLAALESTPPLFEGGAEEQPPTNQHFHKQHQQQQQQQQLRDTLDVSIPSRSITANAPRTPSRKDISRGYLASPASPAAAGGGGGGATATAAASSSTARAGGHVSWLLRSATPVTGKSLTGSDDGGGDNDSQLSGLTGMMSDRPAAGGAGPNSKPPAGAAGGVSGGRSGSTAAAGALGMCHSVAPPATRHLSGPMMDNNWDFDRVDDKPVRALLQVTDEADVPHPVTLLLLVSAPPPRPEVMATIVLPKDPPQAGVDLAIDANTDLAFPSNSFIGQGAFGQVHRALLRGRHPVAVKMLTDPDLRAADPDTLRSFREELMIMAKLDHPHILRCYGGNLDVVNPFIVTELCECSLDKMIAHYRRKTGAGLPLKHTLTIGLHIASALWHLHPSIVHRDLKPQNVLLDISGTAKVADFGLSRMKTHTFVSTRHVEAGTAAYMAPECFGNAGVGEKVDIYALGMLLWECIMGVRPWKGCNMVQIAFQVVMQGNRPELPPSDPARCPAELSQLITDCWAVNPKERPSSGEVMKALAQMIRVYVAEQ